MATLPRILLNFMAVDFDGYMRRPALYAVAEAAKRRGTTVVAVNRPLCPFTTILTKRQRTIELFKTASLEQLADNLYLYSPIYFLHDRIAPRIPGAASLNLTFLRRSYKKLQVKLGITEPNPIIWYNYPEQGYVSDLFERSFNVYELYDQLSDPKGQPLTRSQMIRESLISKTHLLLTTSHRLQEKYEAEYARSYMFGNGLSRSAYEQLAGPIETRLDIMESIPSPRLGYAGVISQRLDSDLLGSLAKARPDWQLVLVGPEADGSVRERIGGLKNVHFTGPVAQDSIPAVLSRFDVGLLPYQSNDFFEYLNPLKFYEMAAAGIPVVSWPNAEMERFPEQVIRTVPKQLELWTGAIESMLSQPREKTAASGRELARQFIWEDMAERLFEQFDRWLIESIN